MKIDGWECVMSEDGSQRAVTHPENGSVCWISGSLIGQCDMPRVVLAWLLRPTLSNVWLAGCQRGQMAAGEDPERDNPYAGEPPNKDTDPS